MNFEFLKGLKELTYIYENCTNAEKLACSMPIKDDVDADGDGFWVNQECFAVATWRWTDHGFRVEAVHY